MMFSNMLILHGGGPTAVINSSLYGSIKEAKKYSQITKIYGVIGGSIGLLNENFIDLKSIAEDKLNMLLNTPASALGTSRDHLEPNDYDRMVEILIKYNIKYVLLNGGNGTMDTCGKLYEKCKKHDILVVGIPKTIDNDISVTDHCPGFGSAARYMVGSISEIVQDLKSLPIHVVIVEALGRNAGWITASSALAKRNNNDGPDLIYLPEKAFNRDEFLDDVKRIYDEKGRVLVIASEGLKYENGNPIVEPVFSSGRSIYFGDVSAHLATLVIKNLGIKARSEKPGILGRASIAWQSEIDREEAIIAGEEAVKSVISGKTGVMVGFERVKSNTYTCKTVLIPIKDVQLNEKIMPENFINQRGNFVTQEFIDWCRPLIGSDFPEFISFRDMI